jgi:peptidyl-prolyl cis-trans isomerase A (cyclophilin A)
VFVNFIENKFLDSQGFAPFGEVVEGMEVVDKLYSEYGENPSKAQHEIQFKGNEFLNEKFPKLDGIKKATIVK